MPKHSSLEGPRFGFKDTIAYIVPGTLSLLAILILTDRHGELFETALEQTGGEGLAVLLSVIGVAAVAAYALGLASSTIADFAATCGNWLFEHLTDLYARTHEPNREELSTKSIGHFIVPRKSGPFFKCWRTIAHPWSTEARSYFPEEWKSAGLPEPDHRLLSADFFLPDGPNGTFYYLCKEYLRSTGSPALAEIDRHSSLRQSRRNLMTPAPLIFLAIAKLWSEATTWAATPYTVAVISTVLMWSALYRSMSKSRQREVRYAFVGFLVRRKEDAPHEKATAPDAATLSETMND